MQRRDFFRLLLGTPFAVASPIVSGAESPLRTLVLIELSGGNDGLNTLIPYRDKLYYQHRRQLAISGDQVLPLSEQLALHPALQPLLPWWRRGDLAWVQGLGYANPNRSHFSSLDIWETGSGAELSKNQGWLANVLSKLPQSRDIDGISLSSDLGPLSGISNSLLLSNIDRFLQQANSLNEDNNRAIMAHNSALDHIRQVANQASQSANTLAQRLKQPVHFEAYFPSGAFGQRLHLALQLMLSGIKTPVIKLSLSSFDTHNNQRDQHDRLLGQLATGLHSFASLLAQHGLWRNTVIMTYSEFGRRVIENASQGTDHGTAAPHLIMGGSVRGGLYGATPSLQHLDNGDLRFTTDFRQLYATLTQDWWQIDKRQLQSNGFHSLNLFKS